MTYKWDDWRDTCHRLYVLEKKSIDEIIEYCQQRDFTPSKRALEAHLKTWGFRKLAKSLCENANLVQTIGELWQNNLIGADIVTVLAGEGYDVTERQIATVKKKNGWFVRERPNVSSTKDSLEVMGEEERESSLEDEDANQDHFMFGEDGLVRRVNSIRPLPVKRNADQAGLKRHEVAGAQLSTSRRRALNHAANSADPTALPPRFPSEQTIDDSKFLLQLSNDAYRNLRNDFETICREMSIVKKTQAGPEKWHAAKAKLIASNSHLARVIGIDSDLVAPASADSERLRRLNAVEVICSQVTKRLRIISSQMTVRDAKTMLGLSPSQARVARASLQGILRAGHLDVNESRVRHWSEARNQWLASSPLLKGLLDDGKEASEDQAEKLKAADRFARDVWKRMRDIQKQNDPNYVKKARNMPLLGPGPMAPAKKEGRVRSRLVVPPPGSRPIADEGDSDENSETAEDSSEGDVQLDPILLEEAPESSFGGSLMDQFQHFASEKVY